MGRDANSKTRTITLGKYPDISVKEAREAAYEKRRVIKDPVKLSALLAAPTSNSQITFGNLIKEAEAEFGETRKIWQQRGKRYPRSTARQVIECVFSAFLTEPAINISAEEIALRAKRYKPKSGKPSANGQVSRALAYLRPVFDWASHRTKRFEKLGAGRDEKLNLPDLAVVNDPATTDPKILGERDRVLLPEELYKILPYLKIQSSTVDSVTTYEYRTVALRFILLTLCRRAEAEEVRWNNIDFKHKSWTRQVKSRGTVRAEFTHPLSDAAIELLRSLPSYPLRNSNNFVFQNQYGGPLDNWDRACIPIKKATKTEDWHRHDLRRTSATMLGLFGVQEPVVDTLLSHKNPFSKGKTSKAARAYIQLSKQIKGLPDPLRDAVNLLADIIARIESGEILEDTFE